MAGEGHGNMGFNYSKVLGTEIIDMPFALGITRQVPRVRSGSVVVLQGLSSVLFFFFFGAGILDLVPCG